MGFALGVTPWILGKQQSLLIGSCDQGTALPPGDSVYTVITAKISASPILEQGHAHTKNTLLGSLLLSFSFVTHTVELFFSFTLFMSNLLQW